jgi:hypothetical protein
MSAYVCERFTNERSCACCPLFSSGECMCSVLTTVPPIGVAGCIGCGETCIRICASCGCDEDNACEGGCSWSPDEDYCSQCYGAVA